MEKILNISINEYDSIDILKERFLEVCRYFEFEKTYQKGMKLFETQNEAENALKSGNLDRVFFYKNEEYEGVKTTVLYETLFD